MVSSQVLQRPHGVAVGWKRLPSSLLRWLYGVGEEIIFWHVPVEEPTGLLAATMVGQGSPQPWLWVGNGRKARGGVGGFAASLRTEGTSEGKGGGCRPWIHQS